MEETKLRDDAIRIVFKYLNIKELRNASAVCKSWLAIGQNEIKSRGPMVYIKTIQKPGSIEELYSVNKEIIECCPRESSLYMFLTNYESSIESVKKCHCHLLPSNCYSMVLKNNYLKDDTNQLHCMTFPEGSSVKVFTYTFILHCYNEKFYSPELHHNFNSDFLNAGYLKIKFMPFFETARASTCCLLLFSSTLGYYQILNEVASLRSWFPTSLVPIWGGVADTLSVCNLFLKKRECNYNTDIVHIIISGPDMAMWRLQFDKNCETKKKMKAKLVEFKQTLNLKQHSIGLMYTPAPRYNKKLYELESEAFKKVFPDLQFFHIYGVAAFDSTGFKELEVKLPKNLPVPEDAETAIMILTYN